MRKFVFNFAEQKRSNTHGFFYSLTRVSFFPNMEDLDFDSEERYETVHRAVQRVEKVRWCRFPPGLKRALQDITERGRALTYDDLNGLIRLYTSYF